MVARLSTRPIADSDAGAFCPPDDVDAAFTMRAALPALRIFYSRAAPRAMASAQAAKSPPQLLNGIGRRSRCVNGRSNSLRMAAAAPTAEQSLSYLHLEAIRYRRPMFKTPSPYIRPGHGLPPIRSPHSGSQDGQGAEENPWRTIAIIHPMAAIPRLRQCFGCQSWPSVAAPIISRASENSTLPALWSSPGKGTLITNCSMGK